MSLFLQSIADTLGVKSLNLDTQFNTLSVWGSDSQQRLMKLMQDKWEVAVDLPTISAAVSPRELMLKAVIAFAAQLLKVPVEQLSPSTARMSIPEWDSVNHLRLVMEGEKHFGVTYPLETIPQIVELADFVVQ